MSTTETPDPPDAKKGVKITPSTPIALKGSTPENPPNPSKNKQPNQAQQRAKQTGKGVNIISSPESTSTPDKTPLNADKGKTNPTVSVDTEGVEPSNNPSNISKPSLSVNTNVASKPSLSVNTNAATKPSLSVNTEDAQKEAENKKKEDEKKRALAVDNDNANNPIEFQSKNLVNDKPLDELGIKKPKDEGPPKVKDQYKNDYDKDANKLSWYNLFAGIMANFGNTLFTNTLSKVTMGLINLKETVFSPINPAMKKGSFIEGVKEISGYNAVVDAGKRVFGKQREANEKWKKEKAEAEDAAANAANKTNPDASSTKPTGKPTPPTDSNTPSDPKRSEKSSGQTNPNPIATPLSPNQTNPNPIATPVPIPPPVPAPELGKDAGNVAGKYEAQQTSGKKVPSGDKNSEASHEETTDYDGKKEADQKKFASTVNAHQNAAKQDALAKKPEPGTTPAPGSDTTPPKKLKS